MIDEFISKYINYYPIQVSGWADTVLIFQGLPLLNLTKFKPPDKTREVDAVYMNNYSYPIGIVETDRELKTGFVECREEDYVKLKTAAIVGGFLDNNDSNISLLENISDAYFNTELLDRDLVIVEKIGVETLTSFISLQGMRTLRIYKSVRPTKIEFPERSQGDIEYLIRINLLFLEEPTEIEVPL